MKAPEMHDDNARAAAWLSQGLETLLAKLAHDPARNDEATADYDVVIVGSGYGAAIAAAQLAGYGVPGAPGHPVEPLRVCVLERGREYLAGAFPSRMSELAGHVRVSTPGSATPRGRREGLFDLRLGKDVCAVVANGLGGGSLINAGVMDWPEPSVLAEKAWPQALRAGNGQDRAGLAALSEQVKAMLGATRPVGHQQRAPNTFEGLADPPRKYEALRTLAAGRFRPAAITVSLRDGERTSAGVELDACVRCGDCATGCNHNAKNSLDLNLLVGARRAGVQIYTGATVLWLERGPHELWHVHLNHTDAPLRRRQGKPFVLRARRVVLAAGTFGSTEILMRSRKSGLRVSPRLGHGFSANGDLIAVAHATPHVVRCVSDERVDPLAVSVRERVGPTITGIVDLRSGQPARSLVIEDLAVPGPLRWLFEETVTTAATLHALARLDPSRHGADAGQTDPCAVNREAIERSLVVAMLGRDPADGVLRLVARGARGTSAGDGALRVDWPTLRDHAPFAEHHRRLQQRLAASGVRGRVLPNPLWRLLPSDLHHLVDQKSGPLVTVHPLGGCPMGEDASSGVVDHLGQVFDPGEPGAAAKSDAVHPGLVVLDGSIVPTSLGINPALMIATLAMRAIQVLRDEKWGLVSADGQAHARPCEALALRRPRYRKLAARAKPRPTSIEVLERLSGAVRLRDADGAERPWFVELTLRFECEDIRDLMRPRAAALLRTAHSDGARQGPQSRLRIFALDAASLGQADAPGGGKARAAPGDLDDATQPFAERSDAQAAYIAEVSGTLQLFRHEASGALARGVRGLGAWLPNRGLRDSVLWMLDRAGGHAPPAASAGLWAEVRGRAVNACVLATHAGAVRRLDYDLAITRVVKPGLPLAALAAGARIVGGKRLTYARRANPWRQLMQMTLTELGGLLRPQAEPARLELDQAYLARQGVPLLRIVGQQDQPAALADVASFMLYVLRVLLRTHLWSFRAPDTPAPRNPRRLPRCVPGLPVPTIEHLPVNTPGGKPAQIRLTRYAASVAHAGAACPVLLIHGYSASGTTFAHHSVRPNLAEYLWQSGRRDVWIVDLRTSAGMPTARRPWTFEDVAFADIPVAVDYILRATEQDKLDVFAHCMGAAMLGMALLAEPAEGDAPHAGLASPPYPDLLRELPRRIRRLALSQVAPAVVFTPANLFRAYLMRYMRHFLPLEHYRFRPRPNPGLAERLLDRLLATLPYPEDEFDLENPVWPPWRRTAWVGTRHRMDALYGRDFNLRNVSRQMLEHIDDHFGPLSIDTVSQAIHFARHGVITDPAGFNCYVDPQRLHRGLSLPILSVHGTDNGLASVATLGRFAKVLADAGLPTTARNACVTKPFEGFGHQDSLIGRDAQQVFAAVRQFFDQPDAPAAAAAQVGANQLRFVAGLPRYAVRRGRVEDAGRLAVSLGDLGGRGEQLCGVFVPVVECDGAWRLAGREGEPVEWTADNIAAVARLRRPETNAQQPPQPGQPPAHADDEPNEPPWGRLRFEIGWDDWPVPALADAERPQATGPAPHEALGQRAFLVMLLYWQSPAISSPLIDSMRSWFGRKPGSRFLKPLTSLDMLWLLRDHPDAIPAAQRQAFSQSPLASVAAQLDTLVESGRLAPAAAAGATSPDSQASGAQARQPKGMQAPAAAPDDAQAVLSARIAAALAGEIAEALAQVQATGAAANLRPYVVPWPSEAAPHTKAAPHTNASADADAGVHVGAGTGAGAHADAAQGGGAHTRGTVQPDGRAVTFAVASCQYPGGMLDRTPGGATGAVPGPADASYLRLASLLDGAPPPQGQAPAARPEFLILAGDQVYVDATAGLFDPTLADDRFRLPYEHFLGSRGPRAVLGRLDSHMLPDDHEIDDNWEPDPRGTGGPGLLRRWRPRLGNEALLRQGREAYVRYQRDLDGPRERGALQAGRLWVPRTLGGLSFFLADTRTDRSARVAASVAQATIMGPHQWRDLKHWLIEQGPAGGPPRFVASSAMLLPRRLATRLPPPLDPHAAPEPNPAPAATVARALRSDGWDGYPRSLHALLALLFECGLNDVVFLSGDEHLSNVATITLARLDDPREPVTVRSIHSSALYAPYPFANAVPEDFANHETFVFADPACAQRRYRCEVSTWYPEEGDGFGLISVRRQEDRWQVEVDFDRARPAGHPGGANVSGEPGRCRHVFVPGARVAPQPQA